MKHCISFYIMTLLLTILLSSCTVKTDTSGINSTENYDKTTGIITGNSNVKETSVSTTTSSSTDVTVKYFVDDYNINWRNQTYKTLNMSAGSQMLTSSGIYEVTGTLKDGALTVNIDKSQDKGIIYLVLNNVIISSDTSAPINIISAKKVVIILEKDTKNILSQGNSIKVDERGNPSAALFSTVDLVITGEGTLYVTSEYNDGITSKDNLEIIGGILVVKAINDGIVGKDLLAVIDAHITINSGKDGMRSTNETDIGMGNILIKSGIFNITTGNDGLQAFTLLQIDDGTFNITTGGGYTGISTPNKFGGIPGRPGSSFFQTATNTESCKSLKSTQTIIINNGTYNFSCKDDAIHSNGDIKILGGIFTIETDDDAIHADKNIYITNSEIIIKNSYEGIESNNITIDTGKIHIKSSDDGLNVNSSSGLLTINGGNIYMNVGGDGIDSNGSVKMTGGTVYVDGPIDNGNGAIDYDRNFTITGGTLVASGSSGMTQAPGAGNQASLLMYYSTAQQAGVTFSIKDTDNNTIASYTPSKQYSSVVISTPDLKIGESYTIYNMETKIVTFTLTETVTYVNENGITVPYGMGGPGGFRQRPGR